MQDAMKGLEPLSRSLTFEEEHLIHWLVDHADLGAGKYIAQVASLHVVSRCICGCPSIYFDLNTTEQSRRGERIISDWVGTIDKMPVGVMLFEVGGQLSSLEVYSQSGTDQPFGLPGVGSLRPA